MYGSNQRALQRFRGHVLERCDVLALCYQWRNVDELRETLPRKTLVMTMCDDLVHTFEDALGGLQRGEQNDEVHRSLHA